MRAVLWTALACSFLIGSNPNAAEWYTSPAIDTVAPREISFADLFRILTNEVESVFRAISRHVVDAESDLKNFIDEYVKPTANALRNQSEKDFESLSRDFRDAVDDIVKRFNITKNDFRNDFKDFLIFNPIELLTEIQRIIRNKESKLTCIILSLNITNDPELLSELLQAIYDYPESKNELGPLLRQNFDVIVYGKYIQLSDQLRSELKQRINKIVRCYEKFLDSDVSNSSGDEIDIITPSVDLNALIDKIFDEANYHNKELLDKLLSGYWTTKSQT